MVSTLAPQPEKKRRVRKDRRVEILQVTSTLFSRRGYQNTPLSLIAQTVGLTEPGVLHYFPSKAHLLQGVLEYQQQEGAAKYARLFGPGEDVLATFLEVVEDILKEDAKDPTMARFYTLLAGESLQEGHPAREIFIQRYEDIRQMVLQLMENQRSMQTAEASAAHQTLSLVLAVYDGLHIQWLLDPQRVDLAAAFHQFASLLLGRTRPATETAGAAGQ